ncbi:MAG: glutamine amidotransferase [Desulfobacterales bacterium]|nr:MAG: glutamine amidotransferase [Desulfobacterales bacterium]
MKPLKKILIVKMGTTLPALAERRGDFDDWIQRLMGATSDRIQVVKPYEKDDLPDPSGLSGIIITGSHDMVTDRKEWSERTGAWLPSAIATGVPLLGICYGHQLIAHVMGGSVGFNPSGSEFGTVDVQLGEHSDQNPLFDGFPPTIRVHVSHRQSVLSLPPKSTLLASSSKDPHQAYAIGENVWGVQFHPEFDADITSAYIKACAEDLSAEGLNPNHLLGTVEDTPYGEHVLRRFGEIVISRS